MLTEFLRGRLVPLPDEGTEAHLFAVLMPLQVVLTLLFAVSWIPRYPRAGFKIVVLQVIGIASVLAVVHFRHL